MKTQSDREPQTLEINHLTNNTAELTFAENVRAITEPDTAATEDAEEEQQEGKTHYEYDSYTVTIDDRPNLEQTILQNYSAWLQYAKEQENKQQEEVEDIHAKVERLEAENTALQAQILNML